MFSQDKKSNQNKNRAAAHSFKQTTTVSTGKVEFVDNRPEAAYQRKVIEFFDRKGKSSTQLYDGDSQRVLQLVLSEAELAEWADMSDEDCVWMDDEEKKQLGLYRLNKSNQKKQGKAIADALESINRKGNYVSWCFNGENYHINLKYDTPHVTWESSDREHYFFQGTSGGIKDKQPTRSERGQHAHVFSDLPTDVQAFIKKHFLELI